MILLSDLIGNGAVARSRREREREQVRITRLAGVLNIDGLASGADPRL